MTQKDDKTVYSRSELEEKISKLKVEIERVEERQDNSRKLQAQVDEDLALTLTELRHLDHYELSESDAMAIVTLQQRQSSLRLAIQDAFESKVKMDRECNDKLSVQLANFQKDYYAFPDTSNSRTPSKKS